MVYYLEYYSSSKKPIYQAEKGKKWEKQRNTETNENHKCPNNTVPNITVEIKKETTSGPGQSQAHPPPAECAK